MPRGVTRLPYLYVPVNKEGRSLALVMGMEQKKCQPLFSSPKKCEEWILFMGDLEFFLPSNRLYPPKLVTFLKRCQEQGVEFVALDPPMDLYAKMPTAYIESLIAQAEAKIVTP